MSVGAGEPTVMDYDPFDEAVLADAEAYDRLALAAGPVLYFPKYDLYALSHYNHVRAAFADWRRFCSGHGTGIVPYRARRELAPAEPGPGE
ncbi:MAG: cytochrome [Sphingomonas bacterium]|nr:cytochrome [Sphingomonas bacterium]